MNRVRDAFLIREAAVPAARPLARQQAQAVRLVQAAFAQAERELAAGRRDTAASRIRHASTEFDRLAMALATEILQ